MNVYNIKGKMSYYIMLILTLTILILGNKLSNNIIFILSVSILGITFILNIKKENLEFAIIRMLILCIPISFLNVFGETTAESNITWFNIFFIILFIIFIFNILKRINGSNFSFNSLSLFAFLMIFISLIPVLGSFDLIDAMKQYIYISMTFLMVIIGGTIKRRLSNTQKEYLLLDYILSVKIVAIGLIVQMIYIQITGNIVGYYNFFGGYRHAYGFLFSDYSFLSLFLSSGAIMIYFENKDSKNKKTWILEIVFILFASIMTSARTGIAAFLVVYAVYSLINAASLLNRGSPKIILIALINIVLPLGSFFLINKVRPGIGRSGSGRESLNKVAWKVFLDSPLTGIGFGRNNYVRIAGMMPHNIIFQYFAQGGLLFGIPLIVFLLMVLMKSNKRDRKLLPVIFLLLVGSLFIPNIFNSRFFSVILLLLAIRV